MMDQRCSKFRCRIVTRRQHCRCGSEFDEEVLSLKNKKEEETNALDGFCSRFCCRVSTAAALSLLRRVRDDEDHVF
jgi:hypothetical protein